MTKKQKLQLALFLLIDALLVGFSLWLIFGPNVHLPTVAILQPKGPIALAERNLMVKAVLLMLIAVVPTFAMTIFIAIRYRASNAKAAYSPDADRNTPVQVGLISLPVCIIAALAVLTWKTAHQLDPYSPLASNVPPLTVQVVALDWKWLFIYPKQNIATVNFLEIPAGTPINFELTADAPMNSFWIPQLGGQIYAMAGMSTELHLEASQPGNFIGQPGEINGQGFSDMRFNVTAATPADFDAWVASAQKTSPALSMDGYNQLAQPSTGNPPAVYAPVAADLYNTIIDKFMGPMNTMGHMHDDD